MEQSRGLLSPHGLSDPARGAQVAHTHFELLAEDGALPQCRAVPAAVAELKLTLVQAHLRAFSYDDDGVGPALADRPLSGSQAWDLVTDDACAQSYHRGEATGAGDTERWSVRPARWTGGTQPTDPAWVSSPALPHRSSPPPDSRTLTPPLLAPVPRGWGSAPLRVPLPAPPQDCPFPGRPHHLYPQ